MLAASTQRPPSFTIRYGVDLCVATGSRILRFASGIKFGNGTFIMKRIRLVVDMLRFDCSELTL